MRPPSVRVDTGDFFMSIQFNMTTTIKLDPRWRQVEGKVIAATKVAAFAVERKAKEKSPVDTGANRSSIYVAEVDGIGGAPAYRIGPTMDYSAFLEFGTFKMPARPYMVPALESETPRFKEAIAQLMKDLE